MESEPAAKAYVHSKTTHFLNLTASETD